MSDVPVFYYLARAILRVALGIYFRRIERVGNERVPEDGPVIFAANHPQSITDALVLGLAAGRRVHYLAHGGLFRSRLQAWLLGQCGVIPIYRPSDDEDAGEKNENMFAACTRLLERGGAIGIFPEGTSQDEPHVMPMRTGVARIALESEAEHEFGLGVVVVPVGLSFESREHFRSRVLVRFDKPVAAQTFREEYQQNEPGAVRGMTEEIGRRIRRSVVHLERTSLEGLVDSVAQTYEEHLMDRADLRIEGESPFQKRQTLLREIARALDHFQERAPARVQELADRLDVYRQHLRDMRVDDEMIREGRRPDIRARWIRWAFAALLGLPLGAYGLLFNYLPYRITGPLAAHLAPDETKRHYFQLWVGAALFVLAYFFALWFGYAALDLRDRGLTIFMLSLPLAGLFARFYTRLVRRERKMFRYAGLTATRGAAIAKMRRLRREVVDEMDRLLEQYLPERQQED